MTIVIVGTLPPGDIGAELSGLMEDIRTALYTRFPTFVPAHPPVTINVSQLGQEARGDEHDR